MADALNLYGDTRQATSSGHGVDIASQRADDLDLKAIAYLQRLASSGSIPRALDLGCGFGGQAIRMAKAGANVVAMDVENYSAVVAESAVKEGVGIRVEFVQAAVEASPTLTRFDAIVCQRMIHYLPYQKAIAALEWMYAMSRYSGQLFISASGLESELGQGYRAAQLPVRRRFEHLAPEMASKHAIQPPVCLYKMEELTDIVKSVGWRVSEAFLSPFGNVKVIAAKGPIA